MSERFGLALAGLRVSYIVKISPPAPYRGTLIKGPFISRSQAERFTRRNGGRIYRVFR